VDEQICVAAIVAQRARDREAHCQTARPSARCPGPDACPLFAAGL